MARTDIFKRIKNDKLIESRIQKYRLHYDYLKTCLEHSEDFKVEKPAETPELSKINELKITVRLLNENDIQARKLPKNTTGLIITDIDSDSPINYLNVNNIIVEAQKKKIRSIDEFKRIVKSTMNSNEKTILIAIYNNQNQRRYIGVKLD